MNERCHTILKLIVEDYIRSAEPVGSNSLREKHGLLISSATIRNDMCVLEKEGYIRQPHTSAGRIPTEMAYIFYLKHFVQPGCKKTSSQRLKGVVQDAVNEESAIKTLAKTLVDLSGETAIVAFDPRWSYCTGVSNLFAKPDFHDLEVLQALSALVDRFDDVVEQIFETITTEPVIFIGSDNPFGKNMSAIIVKYSLSNNQVGLLGLVGPLRMDYAKNIALIKEARQSLET